MSDDEEDYMSDKFLAKLDDVRPSLIQNRGKKRQVELESKRQETVKRQREEAGKGNRNEKLQESLKQAITADNKGFQLLAKMGYKPGQALGKAPATTEQSETAKARLIEPVGITIKEDRGGLGREAALKELSEKRRQLWQQRMLEKSRLGSGEALSTEEFRRRVNAKAQEKFEAGALKGCQKTCESLDRAADIKEPEMCWFWPEVVPENAEETEDDEDSEEKEASEEEIEYTTAEKLKMLTGYLRTAYLFCFWCGVKYNNLEDIEQNCPGLTRDDH